MKNFWSVISDGVGYLVTYELVLNYEPINHVDE